MIPMRFHPVVSADATLAPKILEAQASMKEALLRGYQTQYASLLTPSDEAEIKHIGEIVDRTLKLNPTMILLVGIGGSNMGTLAIVQALYGSLYNDNSRGIAFYCADTIDNDFDKALLERMERELANGGRVILCIVTKSGTTTESLVNGSLFLELLKKYNRGTYQKYVITITDGDSPLATLARAENFTLLEIPKKVGGRFSVFTAVGLFPLALLGINIISLCRGAQDMLELCVNEKIEQNAAAQSALMLYAHYQQGYALHNLFVFSPDLLMLGNWYKQLIGESLGKKYDLNGGVVEVGITPLVSVGTVDLHSVAQLYLAGPRNTVTTFIDIDRENDSLRIPDNELSALIPGLAVRSISFTKKAIFQGVTEAYANEKRPFMVVTLEEKSAYSIGQFMMMKMFETLYLAKLWNINPFDQPAVELYKQLAHKLMSKG